MRRIFSSPQQRKGQASLEVAVFGAIIIFLIGMIIRTTISTQYAQNQNYKAMRVALSKSLESAKAGKTERNTAAVLYIEDRLVPDFNKFGSLERTPFTAQGSASMTNMLFYPIDEVDVNNSIAKLDVFINGQYYPFTTYALRAKVLIPPPGRKISYTGSPKADVPSPEHYKGWNYRCKCTTTGGDTPTETCYACPIFYEIIPNGTPKYCTPDPQIYGTMDGNTVHLFTTALGCGGVLDNAIERFDLNRNDIAEDDPRSCPNVAIEQLITQAQQHAACWQQMSWQWNGENGTVGANNQGTGISSLINADTSVYPSFDVDADRKEETIYGLNRLNFKLSNPEDSLGATTSNIQTLDMQRDVHDQIAQGKLIRPTLLDDLKTLQFEGIITDVMVLDNQDGDIDLTHDNSSQGTARGLQSETAIYTRIRQASGDSTDQGTYFLVKDGKAYNPENGTYVRSVNKRDQIDLVERHVLLSNDTRRFCRDGVAPQCIAGLGQAPDHCDVAVNPVEVCVSDPEPGVRSGCFAENNISRTCLDTASKMLYVRSRIVNRGGHKWLTDATDKRPAINIR